MSEDQTKKLRILQNLLAVVNDHGFQGVQQIAAVYEAVEYLTAEIKVLQPAPSAEAQTTEAK